MYLRAIKMVCHGSFLGDFFFFFLKNIGATIVRENVK